MLKKSYTKLLNQKNKSPITCLTAYSASHARIIDGKVDLILVGDSLGTVLYGMKNTRGVTMEMMRNHGRAVGLYSKKSLTIIDMPFKSYTNKSQALKNAKSLLNFTNADFIKIETDKNNINIIRHLFKNKINVVAHIGVTPQKFTDFSKIKRIGKNDKEAESLILLSKKLEKAGAKFIVLECITQEVAKKITDKLIIPTIGIGASKYCDGQVLVFDDLINFNSKQKKPKFVKKYINVEKIIAKAVNKFVKEVKLKKFPSKKYSY